jgi:hypothetical protein
VLRRAFTRASSPAASVCGGIVWVIVATGADSYQLV